MARLHARRRLSAECFVLCFAVAIGFAAAPVRADNVNVAVAANFATPMQRIAMDFARDTGHTASIIAGATGSLCAQIENGAPFEVMLSADARTPERLASEKLAVAATRFTYAIGTLVLWSAKPGFVDDAGAVLTRGGFRRLAIANPKLAPYGFAAMETLGHLGLTERLKLLIVQGENVAQAAQFVSTGNAELGFVALSQVAVPGQRALGSYWVVPHQLYTPIRQDAILLQRGAAHAAARALLAYIRGAKAQAVIRSYGYTLGGPGD